MNNTQFVDLLNLVHIDLLGLTGKKGEEYKGNDDDQFANFNRLAAKLDLPREKVLMVYLTKHLDGIENFVRTRREFSEPIDGRITDAILYLILLLGMVREDRDRDRIVYNSVKGGIS